MRIKQAHHDIMGEDFRLTQMLDRFRVERVEQKAKAIATQVQLERDTLLLNHRMEASKLTRNDFVAKSAVLQSRLEEEQRKGEMEKTALSCRLVSAEHHVETAVELGSDRRVLTEAEMQTQLQTASPWLIEAKRMQIYEASFLKADADRDGYVSGAEAR
eukprot:5485903-Amphidinium_carterae.1